MTVLRLTSSPVRSSDIESQFAIIGAQIYSCRSSLCACALEAWSCGSAACCSRAVSFTPQNIKGRPFPRILPLFPSFPTSSPAPSTFQTPPTHGPPPKLKWPTTPAKPRAQAQKPNSLSSLLRRSASSRRSPRDLRVDYRHGLRLLSVPGRRRVLPRFVNYGVHELGTKTGG
jgi:hypothetical protein